MNNPSYGDELARQNYQRFLAETAKTIGVSDDEIKQIFDLKTVADFNQFIDYLMLRFGVPKTVFLSTKKSSGHEHFLAPGETYNEWATEE